MFEIYMIFQDLGNEVFGAVNVDVFAGDNTV